MISLTAKSMDWEQRLEAILCEMSVVTTDEGFPVAFNPQPIVDAFQEGLTEFKRNVNGPLAFRPGSKDREE